MTLPDATHPPIVYPAAQVAASHNPAAAGYLAFVRCLIDLEDLDGFLAIRLERIDTHDNLITCFNLPLVPVAGVGDLALR